MKPGETKISYFITELYGDDMTYLKSYKFTYDLSVNDKKIVSDAVLPITDDQETLQTRQSTFINYVDGMGEENTPNKDNHESVVGKQPSTIQVIETQVVEATRYEAVNNGSSGNNIVLIVVVIALVVVAGVTAAVVLFRKKGQKNENPEE